MKKYLLVTVLVVSSALGCSSNVPQTQAITQNNSADAEIGRYRKALDTNADDPGAYSSLRALLDQSPPISDQQVKTIRELLQRYARAGRAVLVSKQEAGEKLVITGKVRNEEGHEVPGATIYVFQTDANGHYSRNSTMNEGNPRLYAYLKSAGDGSFEFETIRPGGYPAPAGRESEQNLIPQHIHLQVSATSFQFRNLEFVFADDPRLTKYWRDWAANRGHSILSLSKDPNGTLTGSSDIVLRRQ